MTDHYRRLGVVLDTDHLAEVVAGVQRAGIFAFDVETRGVLERHDYLRPLIEEEHRQHVAGLKNPTPKQRETALANIEREYRGMLALDPLRNEVFWIAIAVPGQVWAIPMGHRHGSIITPEEIGDGTTIPPSGHRKLLKSGAESLAKARYYIPPVYGPPPKQLERSVVLEALREVFFDTSIERGNQNVKFDMRSLWKYYGERIPGPYFETMVLQHLIDENHKRFTLTDLIKRTYDGHDPYAKEGKLGKLVDDIDFDRAHRYVCRDARWALMIGMRCKRMVKRQPYYDYYKKDMLVLESLAAAEQAGIMVDVSAVKVVGQRLQKEIAEVKINIEKIGGRDFNPGSNAQKVKLLYGSKRDGGLGLKPMKYIDRERTKPSVDAEALELLDGAHPILEHLSNYSELTKLYSTYIENLDKIIYKNRIHTQFHLHRTVTGRLSSSDPNLHNIPRDSELRELFVAPKGHLLVVADYDQIELRVITMYCQDPRMREIFRKGIDVHKGTAAEVFSKRLELVTDIERQYGKTANFLIGFGGGAPNLAAKMNISIELAEEIIDNYYSRFARIKPWKREVIIECRKKGYVETMDGRRRRLPDITAEGQGRRMRAERQAVNAKVQGTAADICKDAMVEVDRAFRGTDAKFLLQVHDELICQCPEDQAEEVSQVLMKAMGHGTFIKGIPLTVSCHTGPSWAAAKGK